MKKIFNVPNLMRFVFASFIASIIFVTVRLIAAPAVSLPSDVDVRVKSDYILMLLESVVGALAMLLPGYLRRKVNLSIPNVMMIVYAIFLYCAIYLGEMRNFYYTVPHWDTVLHTFSGVALGAIGFSLISLLNKSKTIAFSLTPAFVAIFAFSFAVALGVIWEIYEFTADALLDINMQTYALENGEPLIGRIALVDTMKDLIVDALGAALVSIGGYISMKYKKGWLAGIQLKHNKNTLYQTEGL